MPDYPSDHQKAFRLKPIRVARVSEISESTAAAGIPDEERVNFHIGNPVQDESLSSAYLRMALGVDINQGEFTYTSPEKILEYLGWKETEKPKLDFLIRTIQKSGPYMPRGGYSRKNPHPLVDVFRAWLEGQQEPLRYDTGEKTGVREIILGSGGVHEMLRIIIFALSSYMEFTPARILSYQCELDPGLRSIPNLIFDDLDPDETTAWAQVENFLTNQPKNMPTFMLIGSSLGEVTRRKLRLMSIEGPLFFIEANNVPNHLSLAREAKLVQRVIRLLTPAIFAKRLNDLSTVFIVGNSDLLSVIENVHFNLKGTPSASEAELLHHLLTENYAELPEDFSTQVPGVKPSFEGLGLGVFAESVLPELAERIEHRLDRLVNHRGQILDRSLRAFAAKSVDYYNRVRGAWKGAIFDELAEYDANEVLEGLVQNLHHSEWLGSLLRSFLSAFAKQQPQYIPEACNIVSGSSRTALSILGLHCGVSEVVIPDLSWSYEQCFNKTHAVPLTPTLGLDVDALIAKIKQLRQGDPSWSQRGALAINNPHNATGGVFDQADIRRLIKYCLQNDLYVIDDLAYQNVTPVRDIPEIKTVRQIAQELNRQGMITEAQAERVITVHSMSKIDSFAGARLAIIEIRDRQLRQRFEDLNSRIQPNIAAITLSYLFYRNSNQAASAYWHMRNSILYDRTQALLRAVKNLPSDRNPFGLEIVPPTGSLYPLLRVENLPTGLSLDWLASSLARAGIGMLPLASFARTEEGFETGRKIFRLTLGGLDNADVLTAKTRRLLIHLNRLIAEEDARYNRVQVSFKVPERSRGRTPELLKAWGVFRDQLIHHCENSRASRNLLRLNSFDSEQLLREFVRSHLPERLEVFQNRALDRAAIQDELMWRAMNDSRWLAARLEREFMKDSLQRRQEQFKLRPYDRTVHPTHAYSLQAEIALDSVVGALIDQKPIMPALIQKVAEALIKEYLGLNVTIDSEQEANEIILDLNTLIAGEEFGELFSNNTTSSFLSFWSDWDGSNRPSGQGHRLVAAVVMENVRRMNRILRILLQIDPTIAVKPELKSELDLLPQHNQRFTDLLNEITTLTHQLEQRYRGILPFSIETTAVQRLATRLRLRRDPARVLWQHNDRYERKMLELRGQRRATLEFYFSLNKATRKQLHALIPAIQNNLASSPLLREVLVYRDILQRMVLTPRINQGLVTARDPFAIDTTAYNMYEINAIAGKYGNPGMTLGLQISLSSKPEALISLDRKMRVQAEQMRRDLSPAELPPIWLIPLFEDIDSVTNVRSYLDRVWDYATQSRQTQQSPQERFKEIITEVFIAGSDLSQQVGQANAANLYRKAKYDTHSWLAEHGVVDAVRIKLGSGEPMQRQGGYYSPVAGQPAFGKTENDVRRFSSNLPAAARKSTGYAVTPLQGIFLGGDMRTFQSNLSEQLRFLRARDFVSLQKHVRQSQQSHREDLVRAAETIAESRLGSQSRSLQELERLTIGTNESLMEEFLAALTENFRHILYGREEDVVGIHIISYFIGRSLPQLRDRPSSRRTPGSGVERGQQILANIAEIIPFSKQGSLLRAIAHSQSQTMILGINQLTTGLFRALERFSQKNFAEAEGERMIAERLLPNLPVYEILNTLRIYQDWNGEYLNRIEGAFPAGNSAFVALREDSDAMKKYLPLFQQELLRRHGVDINDFFVDGVLIPNLLPTLRADLAILLQKNLFNTDVDNFMEPISGLASEIWRLEVEKNLQLPLQIASWRSRIWNVLGESLYQWVGSFTELASALYAFSKTQTFETPPSITRGTKLSPALTEFFRSARADDEMRNFLIGAIDYLSSITDGDIEVPVSIIRAMNDVERIAQIEESALPKEKQDVIRFCMLQIARLAGENG